MPYGATFVLTVTHPRTSTDAVAQAKVSAVQIAGDLAFPGINLLACSDVTTNPSPGTIRREVRVPFTAEFMAAHVGATAELAAITGILERPFRVNVPAYDVTCVITLGNVVCP